jgi:hypothetical protein
LLQYKQDVGQKREGKSMTQVAAFGDSLMWGQGVRRGNRFSVLTAQGIGKWNGQTGVGVATDRFRSGAKLRVRSGDAREDFVDTYPSLVPKATDAKAFLAGDESAAQKLYGEVPCTFPTVTWQVNSLPDGLGRTIDVALLCGGANDIDFETSSRTLSTRRTTT